ncbi:MAG: hypothetical protein AAF492_15400, partial [Verrucomicrobiota bacterium]
RLEESRPAGVRDEAAAKDHLKQSREFLTRSLSQTPSGRAKYYLNLVHSNLLRGVELEKPSIELSKESLRRLTNQRVRELAGVISGPGYINSVSVGGKPIYIDLAEQKYTLNTPIRLLEGENKLALIATDLMGNTTRNEFVWEADWQAPDVTMTGLQLNRDTVDIQLTFLDKSSVAMISLTATPPEEDPEPPLLMERKNFEALYTLKRDRSYELLVRDAAGNERLITFPARTFPRVSRLDGGRQYAQADNIVVPDEDRIAQLKKITENVLKRPFSLNGELNRLEGAFIDRSGVAKEFMAQIVSKTKVKSSTTDPPRLARLRQLIHGRLMKVMQSGSKEGLVLRISGSDFIREENLEDHHASRNENFRLQFRRLRSSTPTDASWLATIIGNNDDQLHDENIYLHDRDIPPDLSAQVDQLITNIFVRIEQWVASS